LPTDVTIREVGPPDGIEVPSKETTPAGELRPLIGASRWMGASVPVGYSFALDTAKRRNPSCPAMKSFRPDLKAGRAN